MSSNEEDWESYEDIFRDRSGTPGPPLCTAEDLQDMEEEEERSAVLLVLRRIVAQARLRPVSRSSHYRPLPGSVHVHDPGAGI